MTPQPRATKIDAENGDYDLRIECRCAGLLTAIQARQAEFSQWLANQPQSVTCSHGQKHPIDAEQSSLATRRIGEFKAVYQDCQACAADMAGEWLKMRGVPSILCHASLDNWIARNEQESATLDSVKRFSRVRRGFLLLLGEVGTGKSHLAVAVMRHFRKPWLIKQSNMLGMLRKTYRDDRAEDPLDKAKAADLLVLDEIGLSSGGRDELPLLHEALDFRHGERLPTILTSNLALDGIREVLGPRLTDRLRESAFAILSMSGSSMRAERRKLYFSE